MFQDSSQLDYNIIYFSVSIRFLASNATAPLPLARLRMLRKCVKLTPHCILADSLIQPRNSVHCESVVDNTATPTTVHWLHWHNTRFYSSHYQKLFSLPAVILTTTFCCHYQINALSLPITILTTSRYSHYRSLFSLPITILTTRSSNSH